MKRIKFFLAIAVVILLPAISFAQSGKSANVGAQHFIIFGDSLSDTGNFPEPSNISSPVLKNFNLYIPIASPVPLYAYGKEAVPSQDFLKRSIPEQGLINNKAHQLYSINWPLYFVYSKNQPLLMTWTQHYLHPKAQADSINYAWASAIALGQPGCFHDDGKVFSGPCDGASIIQQRNTYLNNTKNDPQYDKKTKYKYTDIKIPNLGKQVSLYLGDKSVSVKNNTSFFIYLGGNDIGNYLKSKILQVIFYPSGMFHKKVDKQMASVASSVSDAVSRIEAAYHGTGLNYHIYVFTLPKLSNLHEGYTYSHIFLVGGEIKKTLNYTVKSYNQALYKTFKGDDDVQVLSVGHEINTLAKGAQYKQAVEKGLTCINDPSGDYTRPDKTVNANCLYNSNHGKASYFSWNNAHFVSRVNEQVAAFLLQTFDDKS